MLKQDKGLRGLQTSIGRVFAVIPISPNQWTLFSVLVALVAGSVIAFQNNLALGLILFALSALLDAIDGAVARARNEVTKLGGFIDGVADRFVEAIFLFSFMFLPLPVIFIDPKIWLALVIFLGTSMPSYIRAYADHKEALSKEKALALGGICERSERLLLIIIGLGIGLIYSMNYFIYALILVVLLSVITIFQRIASVLLQPKV